MLGCLALMQPTGIFFFTWVRVMGYLPRTNLLRGKTG
jgi:hypothetical protein